MASGGYRQPGNPAPVSGPAQLSRRTDGGPGQPIRTPTGGPYGQAQELTQLQQQAPLAASGGGGDASTGGGPPPVIPFGSPTQQPDTPVTAGADSGPGPDSSALGLPQQQDEDMKALLRNLPVWEFMASQPGASRAARNLVRQLKGLL